MLKKIGLGLVAVIVLVLAFAATRPGEFRVERTVTVQAPPGKVFAVLNDFHQFASWSPWQKLDPAMKVTFTGNASGPGAVYAWEGNSEVGAGRMEILKTEADRSVSIKLDFLQPFEGHNTSVYTLTPNGATTTVSWAMFGPTPYVSKVMGLFVSMDSMIGPDFERGLANLKAVVEK